MKSATGLADQPEAQPMFQSTHSMKSATLETPIFEQFQHVSINALNEECDCANLAHAQQAVSFNPRTK